MNTYYYSDSSDEIETIRDSRVYDLSLSKDESAQARAYAAVPEAEFSVLVDSVGLSDTALWRAISASKPASTPAPVRKTASRSRAEPPAAVKPVVMKPENDDDPQAEAQPPKPDLEVDEREPANRSDGSVWITIGSVSQQAERLVDTLRALEPTLESAPLFESDRSELITRVGLLTKALGYTAQGLREQADLCRGAVASYAANTEK